MSIIFINGVNNKVKLDESIRGAFELEFFSCNNSFYNINQYNRNITVEHFDGISTTTNNLSLQEGFYDGYSLASELQAQLGTITSGYTVSYSPTRSKFTLQQSTPSHTFNILFSNNVPLGTILGFDGNTEHNSQHISSNVCDFNPVKLVFMKIAESSNYVYGSNHFTSTCYMYDTDSSFGSHFTFKPQTKHVFKIDNTNTLTFSFYDKDWNTLDIKNFSIILKKIA